MGLGTARKSFGTGVRAPRSLTHTYTHTRIQIVRVRELSRLPSLIDATADWQTGKRRRVLCVVRVRVRVCVCVN